MERLLADCETPYTDFRVEYRDGVPCAVFDQLAPEQGALLSHFLYPDKPYVGALFLAVLRVTRKEVQWMCFEDGHFKATLKPRSIVLETKAPVEQTGARVRMKFPLGDLKLLLLKWQFECMRWSAAQFQQVEK